MKLVIQTQYLEDYNVDGDEPMFKYKGGETYVMPVDESQAYQIGEAGINWMSQCFETNEKHFKELVLSTDIVDDDAQVCDPWETPWEFEIDHADQCMWFTQSRVRDEYSCWDDDVVCMVTVFAKDLVTGKDIEGSYKKTMIRNEETMH